jgi:hypothetical protein
MLHKITLLIITLYYFLKVPSNGTLCVKYAGRCGTLVKPRLLNNMVEAPNIGLLLILINNNPIFGAPTLISSFSKGMGGPSVGPHVLSPHALEGMREF